MLNFTEAVAMVRQQIAGYMTDIARTDNPDVAKLSCGCIVGIAGFANAAGLISDQERSEWVSRADSMIERFVTVEEEGDGEDKVPTAKSIDDYPELASYVDMLNGCADTFDNDIGETALAYDQAVTLAEVLRAQGISNEYCSLYKRIARRAQTMIRNAYKLALIDEEEMFALIEQFDG